MEKDNEIKPKITTTYAEDMAKVLEEDQKGGLIKKIIHGEEEYQREKRNLSPESAQNRFFILIGALFVVISVVTLFFLFFNKDISTITPEKKFTPLIFNDKNTFLEVKDFSKDEIVQTVLNEVEKVEIRNGGVEGIYLTHDKKIIGLREFIKLIKGNFQPKDDQSRADIAINNVLVQDDFLMGVVVGEKKSSSEADRDFFVLIKVRSVPDVFDSFRLWEKKMFFDLHELFGMSLSSEVEYLLTKDFEDGIVENKNARILYSQDAKIVMAYIFADDNSVIVTNTENAAHEIMLRLASSRVKK